MRVERGRRLEVPAVPHEPPVRQEYTESYDLYATAKTDVSVSLMQYL